MRVGRRWILAEDFRASTAATISELTSTHARKSLVQATTWWNACKTPTMAVQHGKVEPFEASFGGWPSYEELIQAFLRANQFDKKCKVDVFISVIGPKPYALLISLTAPAAPSDKSSELLTQLQSHLSPKPAVIGEKANFHRRCQYEQETIVQFVADMRTLAQDWELGAFWTKPQGTGSLVVCSESIFNVISSLKTRNELYSRQLTVL
ncbi:hypothetical protein HPB51_000124 [Rhipicephalus microplus]|uniref:Uncharacterized protein n=1 Tax=Rhipicephalus microplus TaxID=6941 RepID=A0A9J6DY31_RHIMP|nr:hypothetical protein HPB51_000124 [Rhipicephalus microplus]